MYQVSIYVYNDYKILKHLSQEFWTSHPSKNTVIILYRF